MQNVPVITLTIFIFIVYLLFIHQVLMSHQEGTTYIHYRADKGN